MKIPVGLMLHWKGTKTSALSAVVLCCFNNVLLEVEQNIFLQYISGYDLDPVSDHVSEIRYELCLINLSKNTVVAVTSQPGIKQCT